MTRVQAISRRVVFGLLLSGGLALAAPAFIGHAAKAQPAVQAALDALEKRRLAAISARDAAGLQATLTEDYVHVHSTGKVENRADFVKGTVARARTSTRGPLLTRIYGDSAVITGTQVNQMAAAEGAAAPAPQTLYVTQIAHRQGGAWRYVSMQANIVGGTSPNAPADFAGYPPGPARTLTADQTAVIALETARAAAIANKDFAALGAVLADDYMHIYGGGTTTTGRDAYVKAVQAAPRVPTRGPLTARIYGDVAVLTGDLFNRIEYPGKPTTILDTYVTQVAHRVNGKWQFVSFQITPKTYAR